jgi:2,3,4,5-tetrahydropyridine-2-carboxylate N-succinyltransferase
MQHLMQAINNMWQDDSLIDTKVIDEVFDLLDQGSIRVTDNIEGQWIINHWVKQAILLKFRFSKMKFNDAAGHKWFDKIPLKWENWGEQEFQKAGFRALPGALVRKSAYIAKKVVLMPSFINVGAYVDEGTMVDTWATIGSAAQIGKNCHISGGVGIGGVLEPIQSMPVIIEDDCFIGARSEIAEGVVVERGSVISMGVYIGASTKIIDRSTGEITYGRIPAYSVVVPGSIAGNNGIALAAAIIVKKVDAQTRSKTSINELLRT